MSRVSVLSFWYWDKTSCGIVLSMLCVSFFLPWELVAFYCLVLGPPFFLVMLFGKNNDKTRAESVMIGLKVTLLNLCSMCRAGLCQACWKIHHRTSKFALGNASWCCFDSLSYLLALFLVFLPSRLSTKYRSFSFVGDCPVWFFC